MTFDSDVEDAEDECRDDVDGSSASTNAASVSERIDAVVFCNPNADVDAIVDADIERDGDVEGVTADGDTVGEDVAAYR